MKSSYFNFIELLVVLSVIGILISLIFPSLKKSQAVSHRSICQSNLRQAGIAHALYAYANDKFFPVLQKGSAYRHMMGKSADGMSFAERPLNQFMDTRKFSECPADKGHALHNLDNVFENWGSSYTAPSKNDLYAIGYFGHPQKPRSMDFYEFKDKKIIMGDHPYWANRDWTDRRSHWHWSGEQRRTNILFLDMHVDFFTFPQEYNSFPADEPLDPDRWSFY